MRSVANCPGLCQSVAAATCACSYNQGSPSFLINALQLTIYALLMINDLRLTLNCISDCCLLHFGNLDRLVLVLQLFISLLRLPSALPCVPSPRGRSSLPALLTSTFWNGPREKLGMPFSLQNFTPSDPMLNERLIFTYSYVLFLAVVCRYLFTSNLYNCVRFTKLLRESPRQTCFASRFCTRVCLLR